MPFLIIIPFVLFLIYIKYYKKPTKIGKDGEKEVKRVIGKTIENEQYVINDLIINNEGKTSQIDHIVINSRGIFVIETKNYSGRIYGNEKQREWTQVFAYGNKKYKFYNPLKQNATHVYYVKKVVEKLPVSSLVVFVQNNTRHIEADNVIPLYLLRKRLSQGESVLSIKQMEMAYQALLSKKTDISTQKHVQNIRLQQRNLERGICPRCGCQLVLRNGKHGEFLGCSNYPKCKFIKKDDK